MDSLMEEAIPGFSFAVFKWSIAVRFPFLEKHCGAVLATEVSTERLLKAAAKDHCGARLFLPPAIQVTIAMGEVIGEDAIDKYFIKSLENRYSHPLFLFFISGFTPTRTMASLMRFKAP